MDWKRSVCPGALTMIYLADIVKGYKNSVIVYLCPGVQSNHVCMRGSKRTNWSSLKCLLDRNNTENIVTVSKQISYQ